MDYIKANLRNIVAIAPCTEAKETPIKDPVKTKHTSEYGYTWTNTEIKRVDNNSNMG